MLRGVERLIGREKQQVPPLRFAPDGMTILLPGSDTVPLHPLRPQHGFMQPCKASSASNKPDQGDSMAKLNEAARDKIPATKFAFPKQRKEPLENATHVRNAAARFNQVQGVTEAERRAAWKRIEAAAKKYDVELKSSKG